MSNDHKFIQSIYDTALSQGELPELLQDMCERVGAYGAMIFDCTHDGKLRSVGIQHLSTVYDPAVVQAYVERYNNEEVADQDRLADLSSTHDEVNLIQATRLYSDGVKPGANVAAMARRGVSERYGALLSKESWNTDRFAFQFVEGARLPDAGQIKWAEQMLAHLAKALSMGRAINQHRVLETAMTALLDGLGIGVAVVGPSGQMIHANEEMFRILQDRSEVAQNSAGLLEWHAAGQTAQLMQLMTSDASHGRHGARPRNEAVILENADSGDDAPLFIEVCPLDQHPELDQFGAGTRLVTIVDGSQSLKIDGDVLNRYFPLSKTEVALVGLIGDGLSNSQIADARGRSVETVNSQIKTLLRKTNARNRTELVRVAMGLTAVTPKL